jgi:hypothetical protein
MQFCQIVLRADARFRDLQQRGQVLDLGGRAAELFVDVDEFLLDRVLFGKHRVQPVQKIVGLLRNDQDIRLDFLQLRLGQLAPLGKPEPLVREGCTEPLDLLGSRGSQESVQCLR